MADTFEGSDAAEAKTPPALEVETKAVWDEAIIEAKEKEILRRLAVRELEAELIRKLRQKRSRDWKEARERREAERIRDWKEARARQEAERIRKRKRDEIETSDL